MKDEEINVAIAEYVVSQLGLTPFQQPKGTEGYKCDLSGLWILMDSNGRFRGPNYPSPEEAFAGLIREYSKKNYAGDLNAMHEARKSLCLPLQSKFYDELFVVVKRRCAINIDNDSVWLLCIDASSNERAEAFVRTVGKWKEGE